MTVPWRKLAPESSMTKAANPEQKNRDEKGRGQFEATEAGRKKVLGAKLGRDLLQGSRPRRRVRPSEATERKKK